MMKNEQDKGRCRKVSPFLCSGKLRLYLTKTFLLNNLAMPTPIAYNKHTAIAAVIQRRMWGKYSGKERDDAGYCGTDGRKRGNGF